MDSGAKAQSGADAQADAAVPRAESGAAQQPDVVVPVIAEELHPDAVPVQTGGVRVTKRVEPHDEILQQELRKGRVEVRRVKTDRVVDGPQAVQRTGNTLIVPVVSEVLHIEKRWVVTEEIHITQLEERESVEQSVTVNRERAYIERLDENGNVVSTVEAESEPDAQRFTRAGPESLVTDRNAATPAAAPVTRAANKKRVLSSRRSLIKDKRP